MEGYPTKVAVEDWEEVENELRAEDAVVELILKIFKIFVTTDS